MANNAQLNPAYGNYELAVAEVFGQATITTSGAVLATTGKGVASIVKESAAGQYTITLTNQFPRLVAVSARCYGPSATGVVAEAQVFETPATIQADFVAGKNITVQFYDFAGAAANPASGSAVVFRVTVSNSTAR